MWLWAGTTGAAAPEITTLWQAYLRRFDLEHNAAVPVLRRGGQSPWPWG